MCDWIRFLTRVSLGLGACAVLAIVVNLFLDLKQDTTVLSNSGLVIMTGLAVLAFNYAQVFEGTKEARFRLVRGGELCLLGAMMFLCASILKYTRLHTKWDSSPFDEFMRKAIPTVLEVLTAVLFFPSGLISCLGAWMMIEAALAQIVPPHDQQHPPTAS